MSTPRRNLFGDARAKTAILTRGTDDPSRRALAKWLLGTPAKYKLRANVTPFVLTGNVARLTFHDNQSNWGYRARLGDGAKFKAALTSGKSAPTRLAAKSWVFGRAAAYVLSAAPASFALAGQPAALKVGRVLKATPGALTLTGQAAGLLAGRVLKAQTGTFSVAGQAAGLLAARVLKADPAAFTLTGQNAALTYHGNEGVSPPPPPPPPVDAVAGGGGTAWQTLTVSHPIQLHHWMAATARGQAKVTAKAQTIAVKQPAPKLRIVRRDLAGQALGQATTDGQVVGLAELRVVSGGDSQASARGGLNRSAADEAAIAAILMAA